MKLYILVVGIFRREDRYTAANMESRMRAENNVNGALGFIRGYNGFCTIIGSDNHNDLSLDKRPNFPLIEN